MTRARNRVGRLVAVALTVSAVTAGPAAAAGVGFLGARPTTTNPPSPTVGGDPPGVQSGSDTISILSQSPWVESAGEFKLELAISAADASGESLVVQGHGRLTTRTAFDDALAGRFDTPVAYPPSPVSLSSLAHDANGGVDVNIPVNQTGATGDLPEFTASTVGGSGVFPLQISLANSAGVPQGQPVTTFLVFAAGTAEQTGLPSLAVSVVLPVHAAPAVDRSGGLTALSAGASSAVGNVVSALASYPDVPVSLAVTPQTLDALGSGTSGDKSTLAELAALARAGPDQVLPATYVATPMTGMVAAGLAGELSHQIEVGSSELAGGLLGTAPSPATWVVDQPLDQPTLQLLEANRARRLIVPAAELSALPSGYQQFTFASPSVLVGDGAPVPVYGADTGLTSDFTSPGGSVLAASQLLAELAMIQLETPGNLRGVAVLPPPGWNADPVFIRTLLAGLDGDPLLRAVTATQLFSVPAPTPSVERTLVGAVPAGSATTAANSSVPSSTAAGATTTATTESADRVAAAATAQLSGEVKYIRQQRADLDGFGSILSSNGSELTRLAAWDRQLLTAESVEITAAQRSRLLSFVGSQTLRLTKSISLPAASFTLTSTTGQIPLTILAPPGLRATVVLRLASTRPIFRAFSPHCQILQSFKENCTLTLTAQNTTLKVPVVARSSGVFQLNVALWSPDGSLMLVDHSLTVRSTAVSGVGIVLIVLAVLSLAIWWGRDLRHGRRPRELVPAPADDPAGEKVPPPSPVEGAAVPVGSRATGAAGATRAPTGSLGETGSDRVPRRSTGRHFRSPPTPPV